MSLDIVKDNSPEEQICLLYGLGAVPGSGKLGYVTNQALSCIATPMTQIVQAPGISTPLWFLVMDNSCFCAYGVLHWLRTEARDPQE
jgi:hypothetical protein